MYKMTRNQKHKRQLKHDFAYFCSNLGQTTCNDTQNILQDTLLNLYNKRKARCHSVKTNFRSQGQAVEKEHYHSLGTRSTQQFRRESYI